MIKAKLGTDWVGKGEGATISEILAAKRLLPTKISRHLWKISLSKLHHKTNLILTGEPLTDEDLARIAQCE
jgi:hypothetical protein